MNKEEIIDEEQMDVSSFTSATGRRNEYRSQNSKHFTEAARLLEVERLNSTLEEEPLGEDLEEDSEEDRYFQVKN